MPQKYHVAGLGNAIVDVIAAVEDQFLLTHKIAKGAMTLVDEFRAFELQKALTHRLSLDSIAHATFGVEKTAEGLQAIQWFKEGRMLEIAEYCCYDVKITKMVHEFGAHHRKLHYKDRFGKKLTVQVAW